MKKILLALLLLILLLAGSGSAYAGKGDPNPSIVPLRCTFNSYIDPFYWVTLRLTGMKRFSTDPILVARDGIWQEIEGELFPIYPEVGSVWECSVTGYNVCDDWCIDIVEKIVLVRRIR